MAGTPRASREADEFRLGLLRAGKLGLIFWPSFFAFDLFLRESLHPTASVLWLVFQRLLGFAAFVIAYMAAHRPAPGLSLRGMVTVVAITFSAAVVSMALLGAELGGLRSAHGQGLAFFFCGAAVMLSSPWRRGLMMGLPPLVAYPGTMALAAAFNETVAAQWRDPEAVAFFAAQMGVEVALLAFSVITGHMLWASRRQLYEARRLGRYRLKTALGEGGMNEVWLAWDDVLRRDVALKILRTEAAVDESRRMRFLREARATSQLSSPHTVRIFDYGVSDDGIAFFAMEYLRGLDLHHLVRDHGPCDVSRAVHFARQAALALAEAHERGLVHRDIKPGNLFASRLAGEEDLLRVLDFGVVRVLDDTESGYATRIGALVGTPTFMAPEAFAGEATPRSDVYSLGATLYYLLTGEPPFPGDDEELLRRAHASQRVPLVARRRGEALPPALEALVLRCLSKRPEERFADGKALLKALEGLAGVEPWSADEARAWWAEVGPKSAEEARGVAAKEPPAYA